MTGHTSILSESADSIQRVQQMAVFTCQFHDCQISSSCSFFLAINVDTTLSQVLLGFSAFIQNVFKTLLFPTTGKAHRVAVVNSYNDFYNGDIFLKYRIYCVHITLVNLNV